DQPDPIGNALLRFRPHRSVQKVLLVGLKIWRRFLAEEAVVDKQSTDSDEHEQDADDEALARGCEPPHYRAPDEGADHAAALDARDTIDDGSLMSRINS